MLALPVSAMDLQPGTRVAAFPWDDASGCVLGCFTTIVSVRRNIDCLPPDDPNAWNYVVRWGHTSCEMSAHQLLVVKPDQSDESERNLEPEWQVSFDDKTVGDNFSITGRYRLAGRGWAKFEFVKSVDSLPRYELRLPSNPLPCETPALTWYAPVDAILNRDYVLRTLGELYGTGIEL
ncbi:MAG TPA: hypothetical protein VMP01_23245 [Pirellulaceae bacterium]|nr:hypothetical protein [Pirellulaceae bacterium]